MTRSVRGAQVTILSSQAQHARELRTLEPGVLGSDLASVAYQLYDLKELKLEPEFSHLTNGDV